MAVPLARRNLNHERGKLLFQMLGIAATLALIALLLGLREGMFVSLTAYIDNSEADLVISQLGVKGFFSSDSALESTLHDQLERRDGIADVRHILVADVIFTHQAVKTPVLLIGYNPQAKIGIPWHISAGRAVQSDNEILLDIWLAWRSDIHVGDTVSLLGSDFTVVGLTRETSSWMSPYIFVSQHAAENILQKPNTASFFLLNLEPGADVNQVTANIQAEFNGISVLTVDDVAAADRRVMATVLDTPINVMLLISTAISIAVMSIISYNSIQSRKREYSVLKAIGADNRWLTWLVSRETLYRTILSFVFGTALAYAVAALIMQMLPQFTVIIQLQIVLIVAVIAMFVSVLSALIPIRQMAKIDPATVFNQ